MIDRKLPPIRYAVVGLGHFAQTSVLPAFKRLRGAELCALVSGDPEKLATLGPKYKVPHAVSYAEYDALLATGDIDAVYLVLPNALHAQYAVRAASAGVHVVCEKPMATSELECLRMIEAAQENDVQLMIGYRLHFEAANLAAIEAIRKGKLGEPRFMTSTFSMQVQRGNSRLRADLGGGPLNDIGTYCINAARYLFGDEPIAVQACTSSTPGDERFAELPEQVSCTLRFPRERLASFVVSFGAAETARCEVVGTKGRLVLDPAYHHADTLTLIVHNGRGPDKRKFRKRDQVAAEIDYFSDCIRKNQEPEPGGREGLADVRIIAAIERAIATGQTIAIAQVITEPRPTLKQERFVPAHREPPTIHVQAPTK